MPLDAQAIEFKDFSGGLTDNIFQGENRRYAKADNFLITVDKKLHERDGTTIYDPTAYRLNASGQRVSNIFTAINETKLFGNLGRSIFTQLPDASFGNSWSEILGPTGNPALSLGTAYSQLSEARFQNQIYLANDALSQPSKLFRDQNNAWKAVTAGLPKMKWVPNYPTEASLISACITLANALRTSMISHFNDASGSVDPSLTYQHSGVDKWSLSYFQSQTFIPSDAEYPGPTPVPTPAASATDQASLFTLCQALALAYEHHRKDLAGGNPTTDKGDRNYHQAIVVQPSYVLLGTGTQPVGLGINALLTGTGKVTTAGQAATFLDDLWQKWYWHQLSPFSHSPNNNYFQMNKYLLSTPKIGTVYASISTVQLTPNLSDYLAFAYWVKKIWNDHANGALHTQVDQYGPITLPDPTDYDSASLILFWARWFYGRVHLPDAMLGPSTSIPVTYTSVAGSKNITSVAFNPSGSAVTLTPDYWLIPDSQWSFSTPFPRVISSGSGSATVDKAFPGSGSVVAGQETKSWLHGYFGITGTVPVGVRYAQAVTTGAAYTYPSTESISDSGSVIGVDLRTWMALGEEFIHALIAHEANNVVHIRLTGSTTPDSIYDTGAVGVAPTNGNPFFIPQVASYAYAAFYRYQYTVETNGIFYVNEGAPDYSNSIDAFPSYPIGTVVKPLTGTDIQNVTILQQNQSAIVTAIPPLVNDSATNYDTSVSVAPIPTDGTGSQENFTIELYRTTDGGTTYFFLTSLSNGTLSYTDYISDTLGSDPLSLQKDLYVSGGVVANDQPPLCKFTHFLNGYTYYGYIVDTGQVFPQRIRQSLPQVPDSAPATFFDDLEDEITGISSTRNNLIAGCRDSIYRLAGNFNSLGQGPITHERISDSIGNLNQAGMVKTEVGLFFAGSDGFYYTDGYQLIKISLDLDKTYRAYTTTQAQKSRIQGTYDKFTRRIWWALSSTPTSPDNDVFFIFYLDFGIKPSGVFTKARTDVSWQPASACFFQGNLVIGDSRGYLLKTDANTKTDPKINTGTAPSTWNTAYIPYWFRTCALDMGTSTQKKWITRLHMVGQNVGNASIQVNSINEGGNFPSGASSLLPLAPVQFVKNLTWGDARVIWGNTSCIWDYRGSMDLWRRFPARSLRSDFKQIEYLPGNFVVYRSDDWPQFAFANVDSAAKTATLVTPSGFTALLWPLDVVDYFISFSTDNYATKYLVTALDATKKIITFLDTANTSITNAIANWQISGIKKEQRIEITSFDLHVATFSSEFDPYPGDSGAAGRGNNA